MAEHPNAELIRHGYQAFTAGDMVWLNEHLSENVEWHNPGNNAFSGTIKGREEVLAFFANSVQKVLPEIEVHDVLANDTHAVGILTVRSVRQDNQESRVDKAVQVFHVDADGQAIESWFLVEDLAGYDAFMEGVTS